MPIIPRMEKNVGEPNWLLVVTYVGLIAVVPFGVWMSLVAAATSSGLYENLDPVERAAGGRLVFACLLGVASALVALGGLTFRSRRWATIGGCGVVAAGLAALALGDLWVADGQEQLAVSLAAIFVGVLTVAVGRRRDSEPHDSSA
jgi:hypothetical protein